MGKRPHFYPPKQHSWFSHAGLGLVLVLFLALSAAHSIIVPITQGEDELAHYRYLAFIAQNGRLPATFAERQQAWYRSDWPPLYHLLVGAVVSPLDTTQPRLKDVGESPRRRLVGEIFYPRLIIYTEDANWPWQDGILAWHIGRFISILFSATALVFVYLTALELRRGDDKHPASSSPRPLVTPALFATAATALLAFTPRFLFTSAMLGDDSLFVLLSAIFIWLLLRALRGLDSRWVYAVLGLLLGLSIATKYSTALLPLAVIPVIWQRMRRAGWRWPQAVGRLALCWLLALLGSGWWFGWIVYHFNTIKQDGLIIGVLNAVLATGPDVSMRRVFDFLGGQNFTGALRPEAVSGGAFWQWLAYLFQTFWGVPVLEFDPLFPWAYGLVLLFCLPALGGLWQFYKQAGPHRRAIAGVLALIVALLIPFPALRFFLTFNVLETGQGRHILYPAAQSIPILLMLGWGQFISHVPRNMQHATRNTFYVLPPILLLVWAVFQFNYMRQTYPDPLPVQTTTFNPASIPQPLKHNFTESIQFLGYDFQPDPDLAIINLTLYWKSRQPVDENYRTRVQLVNAETGQVHFTWLSHPLDGRYPTRAWDTGDVVRDTLPLPLAAVPANIYDIQIDWLHQAQNTPLTAGPLQIIQFTLGAAQPIAGASTLAGQNPESKIEYRLWLDNAPLRPRQTIPLSWSVTNSPAIQNREWLLIGPDNIPRPPAAGSDATAIFIVEPDWPSGAYRLGLKSEAGPTQTQPLLTVANQERQFDLPAGLASQPDFVRVEANFNHQLQLIGYRLPARQLNPGDSLPVTLAWQSLAPLLPDALTFAVLLNEARQPYGSIDRYPAGFYSPLLWANGEVVVDSFSLPIRPNAPPGVYYLHVGQYYLVDGRPQYLPLFHRGNPTGDTAVVIGPLKIGGPPRDVVTHHPNPQIRLNQPLGPAGEITLLGYDIQNPKPDTVNLKLRLYWQANAPLPVDYTTFFHLRDAANQNIAQKDQPPAAGRYPTSLWSSGEVIVDEIILPLADVPPGEYAPVVGLYNFATGERLPVPGNPANEIALQPLQLEEPPNDEGQRTKDE